MKPLTISQLAKKSKVTVDTLRYYEKKGIISSPERSGSGYRQYTSDYIDRIIFIKKAQELGFSLAEIIDLLNLKQSSSSKPCDDVRAKAKEKLSDIQEKIELLNRMKRIIEGLVEACENRKIDDDCPILNALSQREK